MAIVAKPKKHQNDILPVSSNDPAIKFIEAAGQGSEKAIEPTTETATKSEAKPIIVRGIDAKLMDRLDREAACRRVSRAAMVRMLLAEHLPE